MKRKSKKIISVFLAILMAVTGVMPAVTAFAGDGVENFWDIQMFYKDTDTIVPEYVDETAAEKQEYVETMKEGQKLNLTYKLLNAEMPDNSYVKWYSDMPTLVDVDQNGVVKAFDSSKGAVIQSWIDNEVKPIPLVGKLMATVLEKALFNDKVDIDSMDTEAIIDIVEAAFGSDSPIAGWIDSYKGQLVDSLRKYLNNINSVIHVDLYNKDGEKIGTVNHAIQSTIPEMVDAAKDNPNAQLLVRTLKFSTGATWVTPDPVNIEDFAWDDLDAGGVTDLGKAFEMLAAQLTIPPMTDRALPPVIVLLSDGQPTDDYKKSLDKLLHLPWGKKAVRIAISIGQDADDDVLQQFTGNRELVLQANNPQALVKMIKWASTAASLVSAPASRPKEMDVVPAGNNTPSATNAPLVLDMNNIPDPGSIGANDVW